VLQACGSRQRFVAKPEPWRASEERACLASGLVRETSHVLGRQALGGPSACGALRPFTMSAAMGGRVAMRPAATLRCPMIPAIEVWVRDVIQPAALRHLRQPVVELKVASSYACRPINHAFGARLSEHGRANALDVSAFILADGRRITVKGGWRGAADEQAFLRAVHGGACRVFTTVLGPHADRFHQDHFHLDLARHGRNGDVRICR